MDSNASYQYARKWAAELERLEAQRRLPVEGAGSQMIGQVVWSALIIGALVLVCWLRGM